MRKLFFITLAVLAMAFASPSKAFAVDPTPETELTESGELLAHGGRVAQNQRRRRQQNRNRNQRQGEAARVQIMLVHATNGQPGMDPELSRFAPHLRHLSYDNFQLLTRRRARMIVDGERTFELVGDRTITVSLLSKGAERARLRVQMYRGDQRLIDTTVAVNRNGTFIVAGPRHNGGVIVMPITVSY